MSLDADATGETRALRIGSWRGLRDERVFEGTITRAIAAHTRNADPPAAPCETLKDDERSRVTAITLDSLPLVVKEVRKGGIRRRLADRVRGSPAMRAFRAGRGLIERGLGAALPVAALERRRVGRPMRSLLVSLDLRADPTAAALLASLPERRPELMAALADWMVALHRAGVRHGDLRTQHVHVGPTAGGGPRLRVIDLESVRLGRRLDDRARLDDWAQLAGSIPEEHAGAGLRREALSRYAAALPFRDGTEAAFRRVEEQSIRRGHLYRPSADPPLA